MGAFLGPVTILVRNTFMGVLKTYAKGGMISKRHRILLRIIRNFQSMF
jgi:hypothetical protein